MKKISFMLALLTALLAGCARPVCPPCPVCPPPAAVAEPPAVESAPAADLIACQPGQGPAIPSRLQAKLFDTAVNTGVGRATRLLQETLNGIEPPAGLKVDGLIGPRTRAALCGRSEEAVLQAYARRQAAFYQGLAGRNPGQAKFLQGWLRRAAWLPEPTQ